MDIASWDGRGGFTITFPSDPGKVLPWTTGLPCPNRSQAAGVLLALGCWGVTSCWSVAGRWDCWSVARSQQHSSNQAASHVYQHCGFSGCLVFALHLVVRPTELADISPAQRADPKCGCSHVVGLPDHVATAGSLHLRQRLSPRSASAALPSTPPNPPIDEDHADPASRTLQGTCKQALGRGVRGREVVIVNLLVRIHLFIKMILLDQPVAMEV